MQLPLDLNLLRQQASIPNAPHVRYVMSGNVSGAAPIASEGLHTVLPIDSVYRGQSGLFVGVLRLPFGKPFAVNRIRVRKN